MTKHSSGNQQSNMPTYIIAGIVGGLLGLGVHVAARTLGWL